MGKIDFRAHTDYINGLKHFASELEDYIVDHRESLQMTPNVFYDIVNFTYELVERIDSSNRLIFKLSKVGNTGAITDNRYVTNNPRFPMIHQSRNTSLIVNRRINFAHNELNKFKTENPKLIQLFRRMYDFTVQFKMNLSSIYSFITQNKIRSYLKKYLE